MRKIIQVANTTTDSGSPPTMLLLEATDGVEYWFPKRRYRYWRVPTDGELVTIAIVDEKNNDWKFIPQPQQ